jgi:precorrin-6Y C5,15-methyltransferase (decarboxylating)
LTFCLLGDAGIVAQRLCEAGLGGVIAHVGENLDTPCEKVYSATAADLIGASVSPLAIIAFVNESFDAGVHFGIPENRFERLAKIPMTKPEVRAVIMSKLKLKPTSICFDIGAGTGSVAVEMGLACHQGHICAIEKNPDAALLIKKNLKSFHLGNVSVIEGEAPCALSNLPRPDAVFVGGSGGKMKEIIRATLALNPLAELVASAATLETVHEAASAFDASGIEWEAFQISVSKSKPAGGLHLMAAQNPVTLICRASTP